MGLGVPGTPFLNYIPGNAVQKVFFTSQSQEFGYQTIQLTFATLPTPATAGVGAQAWISDATSRVGGALAAGGGAIITPVWCDGITWYIGGGS